MYSSLTVSWLTDMAHRQSHWIQNCSFFRSDFLYRWYTFHLYAPSTSVIYRYSLSKDKWKKFQNNWKTSCITVPVFWRFFMSRLIILLLLESFSKPKCGTGIVIPLYGSLATNVKRATHAERWKHQWETTCFQTRLFTFCTVTLLPAVFACMLGLTRALEYSEHWAIPSFHLFCFSFFWSTKKWLKDSMEKGNLNLNSFKSLWLNLRCKNISLSQKPS